MYCVNVSLQVYTNSLDTITNSSYIIRATDVQSSKLRRDHQRSLCYFTQNVEFIHNSVFFPIHISIPHRTCYEDHDTYLTYILTNLICRYEKKSHYIRRIDIVFYL